MRRNLPIVLVAAALLPLLAWAAITASFTVLNPGGTPPPARRSAGLALEERGGGVDRLHLYGGYNGSILGTQFFYDTGTGTWTPVTPAASPGVRERHGLGWDPVRSRLVLFAGGVPNGFRNNTRSDVWVYSETTNTWTALTNSTSVTIRVDPLMVYVPPQGKFFVFGGVTAYGFQASPFWLNDAWWLDADPAGTAIWTSIVATGGPPVSGAHCAAYDLHRNTVVLFGGETTGNALLSDTWQYDVAANTWSNDPATGDIPSARAFCQTSYDPVLRRVVLYGGQDASGNPVGGLYLYDPVTFIWTQVTPTNPPGTVSDSSMVYSPAAQAHFLYGGRVSSTGYDGRTYRLDLAGGTPPTANAGADFNTNEDVSTQLNGSGTSPGTITYQWTQLVGPAVTLSDPNLPTPTFQSPRVTAPTSLTFSLEVDDGTLTASDSVTVTVLDTLNEAPTAAAGDDASVGEGSPVVLWGSGTDPNGEALTYAWTQLSGPAVTLSGAGTATPNFIAPSVVTPSALVFELTVTDARGAAATDQVTIQVDDTFNEAPSAAAGNDASVGEGVLVSLSGSGTDPNGESLTYAWTQVSGPVVTLTGASTATPSFTSPSVVIPSALVFELTVTDARSATDTDQVTVQVQDNVNEAPSAAAGNDASVGEGAAVSLSGSGTDPNGESLTYAWTQVSGPVVTLIGASTATPSFTAPSVVTATTLVFRLTVTDARSGTGTDQVAIQVQDNVNEPPTVNAGTDTSVNEGAAVSLIATASDPNSEALSYLWEQTSGPAVSLTDPTAATAGFTAPSVLAPAVLVFRVTVGDPRSGSATDSVSLTVQDAVNEPPTAVAGTDAAVGEAVPVSLTGSGTDPNGEALSYAWTQLSGPPVSLNGASSATADFTSPSVVSPAALVFELAVTDARGATTADQVTVQVDDDVNELPVASAGADQSARSATPVTLDASASSDPNAEALSFAWTQLTGTPVDLSDPASAQATFVVPGLTVSERVEFQVTVTDARGGVDLDQVAVELLPPAQPCAFVSTGTATAVCGSPYQYAPAIQGDGPFTFALDSAPPGATVDPVTGAITWTPTAAESGSQTLSLRCVGPGGEAVQQVAINVDCTPEELTVGCGCSGSGASSPLLLALASLFAFRIRSRRFRS